MDLWIIRALLFAAVLFSGYLVRPFHFDSPYSLHLNLALSAAFGLLIVLVEVRVRKCSLKTLIGAAVGRVLRRIDDPVFSVVLSFLAPVAVYVPAQLLGLSGVLATVAAYHRRRFVTDLEDRRARALAGELIDNLDAATKVVDDLLKSEWYRSTTPLRCARWRASRRRSTPSSTRSW